MSYRSLNGITGSGGSANSLIKTNNLSDLTNVSLARTNLGLIGSLDVATSPYISITSPFNGTSNQQISVNATTDGTYDTLVAYNNIGDVTLQPSATLYTGYVWTSGINYTNIVRKTSFNAPFSIFDDTGNILLRFQQSTNKCYIPGNVGIGTTNPMYKLHVIGDAFVSSNIHLSSIFSGGTEKFKFISNTLTTLSSGLIVGSYDPNDVTLWDFPGKPIRFWCDHFGYIKTLSSETVSALTSLTTPSIIEAANYGGITLRDGFDTFDLAKLGYRPNYGIGNYDIYSYFAGSVGIGTYAPTRPLHVEGNGYFTGNFQVEDYVRCDKLITNTISSIDTVISFDSKSIDMVHDVTVYNILYTDSIQSKTPSTIINVGDISLATLTVDTITSTGSYISFSDKNVGNIDNLTVNLNQTIGLTTFCSSLNVLENANSQTDYTYSFDFNKNHFTDVGDISCRNIDVNNYKINNIANITKQLWAYTNTTTNTSTSITSIPAASQPVMTIITGSSTNYTFRTSVGFTYNGEKELRFKYAIQPITSSSGVFLTLGVYDYNGTTLLLSVSGTPQNSTATIPGSLSITLTGLTIGTNYQVCWMDKSGTGGITYNLFCPEISLSY